MLLEMLSTALYSGYCSNGRPYSALTVIIIKNGLTFIGVDAYWQDVVFGLFVLVMIVLSIDRSKSTRGIAVK